MHHRVLQRQMKKFGVEPEHPPLTQEAWARFLEHVNRFYHEADQDRYLLERSLSISSREMREIYEKLLEASESRVAAERNRLRAVISSLGAGLCTLDEQGHVLSINPEGERLLGCTEADVLGLPFFAWTVSSGDGQVLGGPCSLEEVMASGQSCREEDGAFVRKDGGRLPVSYTINPIIEEGTLRGAVLVFFDITERKEAEQALRESEERHRTLLNHLPVGVYRSTPEGRFIKANPATAEVFGAESVEALLEWDVKDLFFDAEDRDRFVERLLREGIVTTEFAVRRIDGQVIWVRDYARAIQDTTNGSTFFDGMLVDITEQKQAAEALRESEERLRAFVEALPGLALILDEEGRYVEVFTTQEQLLYAEAAQLKGKLLREVLPEAAARLFLSTLRRAIDSGATQTLEYELEVLGGPRWFEGHVAPMPGPVGERRMVIWISHDITERKRAEEALRASEQRFRELFEGSPDAIFVEDFEGNVLDANPAACQLHGLTRQQLIGQNVRALVPPEQHQNAMEVFAQMVAGELDRIEGESWTVENKEVPVEISVSRITHSGQPALLLQVRDITERKRAEEALRRSEERYTLAVSAGNVGVWDWNLETDEIYIDPILKKILGYQDHEIENQLDDWGRHVHPNDQQQVMEAATAHLEGATPVYEVEHRMLHRDGSVRWFVARGTAMRDAQGKPVRMVGTDTHITERKQAEQELARINAKLEQRNRELQDFAYAASHDLQEPLRKIRAFADLMQEDYGDKVDETGHYYLDRMQDAAARMSGLITDLLAYSRVTTKVSPFGRVDLNAVVADVLSDLEMQIEETNGRIILSNLPAIEADATQMHQLLQNFIGNALKFHQADVPPVVELIGHLEQQRARDGDAPQTVCRLEVRDNGIGFDEKYLDRIFTPFQRLHGRSAYAGTGMGLAICRRIVERHHGAITARSAPGEGATFIVTLPVYQRPARRAGREGDSNG